MLICPIVRSEKLPADKQNQHAGSQTSAAALAAGMLRADCLGATLCSNGASGAEAAIVGLQKAQTAVPPVRVISQQSMFSVLVHAPPVFRG